MSATGLYLLYIWIVIKNSIIIIKENCTGDNIIIGGTMKIRLPNLNGDETYIENKQSIILIGANGAGKTRMSVWIDENNKDINIHRISAQKSLNMPKLVSPTELSTAEEQFIYGTSDQNKEWLRDAGKKRNRWGNNPEIHMLNDFSALMIYLMTENYEKSIEYREKHKEGNSQFDNETKLEKIKKIWERVITHRKLQICAGKIEVMCVTGNTDRYNGSEMSDGERAIFHYIAEAVCAKNHSLIIVDEPENHLHKSILVRLWDAIEAARPDCVFLYITHNLDFASTRINTQIIWVKNMEEDSVWEYELLEEDSFSDDLLLEILGNRQKILLVEGTPDKSTDRKLYSNIFEEYNIIPLEGCGTVIQTAKAYNRMQDFHYKEVKAIVDRDRRTEEEIIALYNYNIFVPKVAEIENLFLLPEVIRIVARKQNVENVEELISITQEKTIDFLKENLNEQALLFTRQKCQNTINKISNKSARSILEYVEHLNSISLETRAEEVYDKVFNELQKIVDEKDYLGALRVINNKGLLPYTNLPNSFGWKKQYYIDYVLRLLNISDECSEELCNIFKEYVPLQ